MKEKDSVENNEKSPDNRKKSGEKIISDNKTNHFCTTIQLSKNILLSIVHIDSRQYLYFL